MRRILPVLALLAACKSAPPQAKVQAPAPAASASAVAAVAPPTPTEPPLPVGDGMTKNAKVTLSIQGGPKHFLGENVLVDWCVENTSKASFVVNMGGDYRGATRSQRFKVTLTDEQGRRQDDPDPAGFSMGGLSFDAEVKPGAKWCKSLPLFPYRRYDAPLTYEITVQHDLGWPEGTAPFGRTKITFAEPSAAEAEAVIAQMEALPKQGFGTNGKPSKPYLDYFALRYPVYRLPLLQRAQSGNAEAAAAIGEIPNVDATKTLITLLDDTHPDVAKAAALALSMRLPDPALNGALGPRNPFANELPAQRKYLIGKGWSPDLAGQVRDAAKKLLAKNDDDAAKSGAFFLEAVGVPSDNAILVDAFSRAIARTETTPRETNVLPTPRGACQELGRAARMLLARGAPLADPSTLGGMAEQVLTKSPAVLHRALTHSNMYIRRLALEELDAAKDPTLLTPAVLADVETNLGGDDLDILYAASNLVGSAKLVTLGPKTAAIVGRVQNDWIVGAAWNAASQVHALGVAVDAIIPRLAEPDSQTEVLRQLIDVFTHNGVASSPDLQPGQGKALIPIWKKVAADHRAAIVAGDRLDLDDPTIPRNLFPEGWSIMRDGKPNWPTP